MPIPPYNNFELQIDSIERSSNNFELQIDNIERFMGYDSSKYKARYMVTKPLPKLDEKNIEERRLKLENKKKRFKQFLLFITSRLFVNTSFSQIKTTNQVQIILSKEKVAQEFFFKIKYRPFIPVLKSINEIEKVVSQVLATNSISRVLNFSYEQPFSIEDFDQVQENYNEKNHDLVGEAKTIDNLFKRINYQKDIKDQLKLKKLDFLLKDKDLIKNFFKAFILNRPQLKKRRTVKKILQNIQRGNLHKLISFVIKKLIKRRKYLWKHINIIMPRVNFILIGKDYKIYKKKLSRTFISQVNKYSIKKSKKKRLNAKYIKCVELIFPKSFLIEFRRFFKYILHINKMLYYFFNKFYSLLFKYSPKLYDKNFVISFRGKIRSFNEVMSRFLSVNNKGKKKLMLSILLMRKHQVEKRLLKNLRQKRELPLERYIKIMEREKYYPKHRRTKLPLRIQKWLMKHVYDDMALEFKESYSRPRVIVEKREEIVETTYPYLPRDPLRFQRDVERDQFKKSKPVKFQIIKITRPKVVLQSKYFNYYKTGKSISKNLLRTKLNSKVNVPQRVQRILRFCESFYKNLLKGNSYKHFLSLINKFKILYLYKPYLKNKLSTFIGFFLLLIVSPIFRGITEERDYAHQLKVFLNNYLVRLRLFKRYDLANSFNSVNDGYILPTDKNLDFYKKIIVNARKIMQKKPNYIFMRYMYRRSFKRLTIRIRSKIATVFGVMPLFRYNLMATDSCSPMNLKKRFMNKGCFYLLQPNVDFKVKSKYRFYISALKRTYGYSAAYHTNAKFYYFSPYNLFLKKFNNDLLPEEDIIAKYQELCFKKNNF